MIYEDGDSEDSEGALLAAERVRLEVRAPEALPAPSPADLRAAAGHLRALAVRQSPSDGGALSMLRGAPQ